MLDARPMVSSRLATGLLARTLDSIPPAAGAIALRVLTMLWLLVSLFVRYGGRGLDLTLAAGRRCFGRSFASTSGHALGPYVAAGKAAVVSGS